MDDHFLKMILMVEMMYVSFLFLDWVTDGSDMLLFLRRSAGNDGRLRVELDP